MLWYGIFRSKVLWWECSEWSIAPGWLSNLLSTQNPLRKSWWCHYNTVPYHWYLLPGAVFCTSYHWPWAHCCHSFWLVGGAIRGEAWQKCFSFSHWLQWCNFIFLHCRIYITGELVTLRDPLSVMGLSQVSVQGIAILRPNPIQLNQHWCSHKIKEIITYLKEASMSDPYCLMQSSVGNHQGCQRGGCALDCAPGWWDRGKSWHHSCLYKEACSLFVLSLPEAATLNASAGRRWC